MEEQLAHIMYEKLSMEIYELMEQKKYHTGNRDMISMEMNELELETEYLRSLSTAMPVQNSRNCG